MGLVQGRWEPERKFRGGVASLTLSRAAEALVKIPRAGRFDPFSLKSRRIFQALYDDDSPYKCVGAGRQLGKSLYDAIDLGIPSALIPNLRSLYVSPTHRQTADFSRDKLEPLFHYSEELNGLRGTAVRENPALLKRFISGAEILLRYAFHSADRIRGITTDRLYMDEFQDILSSTVPVIEECQHATEADQKRRRYTGTFKGYANPLAYYYLNESTAMEWVVPCRRHSPRYWNLLGMGNIGKTGLICDKCGNLIDPNDDDAQWVVTAIHPEKRPFAGYRIPQIALPTDWADILMKLRTNPQAQFYNDVLALPFDSGTRPLTPQDIYRNCQPEMLMGYDRGAGAHDWSYYERLSSTYHTFAGIDWGTGNRSYTVLTLGTYQGREPDGKFDLFFHKKFEGAEAEPEPLLAAILHILEKFHVAGVGVDYGFGFGMNDRLAREYGANRVKKFEYVTSKRKTQWDGVAGRFKLDRTEVMSDFFNALKRADTFNLPNWNDFSESFAKMYLAEHAEYNESLRHILYNHSPDDPDDAIHSSIYCFLASNLVFTRPQYFHPYGPISAEDYA